MDWQARRVSVRWMGGDRGVSDQSKVEGFSAGDVATLWGTSTLQCRLPAALGSFCFLFGGVPI